MPILFMQAAPSNRRRAVAHAANALVAACAGWFAHAATIPAPEPSAKPARPRPAALIAVANDQAGVRSRAASMPERTEGGAAGRSAVRTPAVSAPPPALPACPESVVPHVDAGRVLQSIEGGTEAERFQGLMIARSAGIGVGEPLLKRLFESGDSERVQMAAFEDYLALRADRPGALRAALEQAQHAPSPAIQRDAGQRLAELAELQRLDTLPPLTDP